MITSHCLYVSRKNNLAEFPSLHALGEANHHRVRGDLLSPSRFVVCSTGFRRLPTDVLQSDPYVRNARCHLATRELLSSAWWPLAFTAEHAHPLDVRIPRGTGLGLPAISGVLPFLRRGSSPHNSRRGLHWMGHDSRNRHRRGFWRHLRPSRRLRDALW